MYYILYWFSIFQLLAAQSGTDAAFMDCWKEKTQSVYKNAF